MSVADPEQSTGSPPEVFRRLYERHRRGAFFRSAAVLLLCAVALMAYLVRAITLDQLFGILGSALFVILINPPVLWVLSRARDTRQVEVFSILINLLEVSAYTAIIHFMGGLDAAYMAPMYCILIAYVGMVGPWRYSVIVAVASVAAFALVVLGEHFGILDSHWPLVLP
ncbi:MAG: hypothetical protein KJ621_06145, partial [Proteobacteria bacterium]|nr:hypothetical protein [Pseudomonadota bacterium]